MRRLILAATLTVSLASAVRAAQPLQQPLSSQQTFPSRQTSSSQQTSPSQQTLPPPPSARQPQQNAQQPPLRTLPGPASDRHLILKRYRYSSYGTWVKTMGPGYPAYRYTYSGQKDNFPLPAIFQSGSEHTNYTGGPGF